ncbi:MAG TPA: hypothetical protein IAC64_10535 [Candidatus Caccomorpha excrementavium]|nr:hypothetical protein [Candidatus Caccomorpha excrementavium]
MKKEKEKRTKRSKPAPAPQYYTSAVNIPVRNYEVYYLSAGEKILYFLLAFAAGGAVAYLFYGGVGKNEFGEATTVTWIWNVSIIMICGLICGRVYLPIRAGQLMRKRKAALANQFRDLLDALSTLLGSGANIQTAFFDAYDDLSMRYMEGEDILKELANINAGIRRNIDIGALIRDFGNRSGIDDIKSFADVFEICGRSGNYREVIRSTHHIISDKMAVEMDIETSMSAAKMEQNMMSVMPVILVALIKISSPEFSANFSTVTGIISTTVAVILFVAAALIAKAIMNIKV